MRAGVVGLEEPEPAGLGGERLRHDPDAIGEAVLLDMAPQELQVPGIRLHGDHRGAEARNAQGEEPAVRSDVDDRFTRVESESIEAVFVAHENAMKDVKIARSAPQKDAPATRELEGVELTESLALPRARERARIGQGGPQAPSVSPRS